MQRKILVAALVLCGFPQTVYAQVRPEAAAIDPGTLAAARQVIDQVMPPAQRDQMIGSMVQPMIESVRRGLTESSQFKAIVEANPKAATIITNFIEQQQRQSIDDLRKSLPQMAEAMARAYARRFTVAQLHDISVFFGSPSGAAYLREAPKVMSDPDVSAWVSAQMRRTMEKMPARRAELMEQLAALEKAKP